MKIGSIKIEADVYTWVTDRAEHIRENNPDMPEGQEYAIAWLQYKKKNPKWKPKKEKEAELLLQVIYIFGQLVFCTMN